jgi:hypothetical protein
LQKTIMAILHSLCVAFQRATVRYGATEAVLQHSGPSYVSFHGPELSRSTILATPQS